MRILSALPSMDPVAGGPVAAVRSMAPELVARGHERTVVCLDRPDAPWLAGGADLEIVALGPGRPRGWGWTPTLHRWVEAQADGFDAVVIHGLWGYHGVGTWRALSRRAAPPWVVMPHGMLDPAIARRWPLRHLKKQLYWSLLEHRVVEDAAALLFTTAAERDRARGTFTPYRPRRERVVPYGTPGPPADFDIATSRARLGRRLSGLGDRPYLLFLGRIHPKKGVDMLLDAFAGIAGKAPGLQLMVAGPDAGDMVPRLQARAARSGIEDRLHWPGMLHGDDKWAALAGAEAFVLPSLQENFAIAAAEAAAVGTPLLLSEGVAIHPDVVAAGAGLARPPTRIGTRRLLAEWLDLGVEERAAMAEAARRLHRECFGIGPATEGLLSVLAEVSGTVTDRR